VISAMDSATSRQEAEERVIASVIHLPRSIPGLLRRLRPEHFGDGQLRHTWRLLDQMHQDGRPLSSDTIKHFLLEHRDDVGLDRIKEMLLDYPADHAPYYADVVIDYARRAKGLELVDVAAMQFRDPNRATDEILEALEQRTAALQSKPTTEAAKLRPVGVGDLVRDNPNLRPVVIDGLLREGETANLIAASKTGKSFLAVGLAWSIATGRPWLGHAVEQGKVLILDNELHPETISRRLADVARAMQIDFEEHANDVEVLSLRSMGVDLMSLGHKVSIEPGRYRIVIIDALYRFIPLGVSENDNAQMMRLYNRLDELAEAWQAALVVVHHSSKGDQAGKSVTDVGSGAGAISRAADTHLTIRPHDQDGLAVLESACRSFKSPEPVSLKYEYPCWDAVTAAPVLKRAGSSRDDKQKELDAEADEKVLEEIRTKWFSEPQIVRRSSMGPVRVARAVDRLLAAGAITRKPFKVSGKRVEKYRVNADFATVPKVEKGDFANDFKAYS
jgi:hypothetical protein